jgi:RNA-directed DNA polymerase
MLQVLPRTHCEHSRTGRITLEALHRAFKAGKRNRGAAGLDKQSITMFEANWDENLLALMRELKSGTSQPIPLRRVSIPKGKGAVCPLGIPAVRCRVAQDVIRALIPPIFEPTFHDRSHGFRRHRSCHTAMAQLVELYQHGYRVVVDADLQGFFESIPHPLILDRVACEIADGNILRLITKWLRAGVMEEGEVRPTHKGTPQGGGRSPLLANIALDGLERLFGGEDTQGNPQRPSWKTGQNKGISLIRYADDRVVVAPSRTVLEHYVLPTLARFLAERGLRLSEAKTHIVHSTGGFNFLGFEIRRFPRALLTQPQKAKMLGHYRAITTYLHQHKQSPAVQVIHALNPKMRGWGNYYRHCAATRAFRKLDHMVWHALWRWAKRRHPNKSAQWVRHRYFRTIGHRQGVFAR